MNSACQRATASRHAQGLQGVTLDPEQGANLPPSPTSTTAIADQLNSLP